MISRNKIKNNVNTRLKNCNCSTVHKARQKICFCNLILRVMLQFNYLMHSASLENFVSYSQVCFQLSVSAKPMV